MSDDSATLIPTDIREVAFYGDTLVAALVQAGDAAPEIFVPLRPICDNLGLSWSGQRERLLRDEVLREAVQGVRVTRTPSRGRDGGPQASLCLPLRLIPGWLFGINAERVKPELRERILRYRRECFQILWNAFRHDVLSPIDSPPEAVGQSGAQLAYEIATAIQHLARQQMELEQRMQAAGRWARTIDARLSTVDNRLAALELQLSPQQPISEEQSADLALAVKAVAHALEQRGVGNSYQRVYGELYRQQSITSYKNLPRSKFEAVMAWLKHWHSELTAPGRPDAEEPAHE